MSDEAPRELGDLEDAEPERRPAGQSPTAKKPLDEFLAEFEERVRLHPGEPATSAGAALEGRAEGVWRTPVEGAERPPRRLGRAPWRRAPAPRPVTELPASPLPPFGRSMEDEGPGAPSDAAGSTEAEEATLPETSPGTDAEPEVQGAPASAEVPGGGETHAPESQPAVPEGGRKRLRRRHRRRHR